MTGVLVRFGRDSHPSFTEVCLNRHRVAPAGSRGSGRAGQREYSMQYVHCIR